MDPRRCSAGMQAEAKSFDHRLFHSQNTETDWRLDMIRWSAKINDDQWSMATIS